MDPKKMGEALGRMKGGGGKFAGAGLGLLAAAGGLFGIANSFYTG